MSKKNDIFGNRYSYANGDKSNIVVSDDFEDISSNDNKQKGKKKKKKKKGVIISIVSILTVVALILGLWWYVFGGMEKVLIDKTDSNLGINENFKYKNSGVVNIALFGIDASSSNTSRSDTVMVISVNRKQGTIKVSSILRDSYVAIELPNGNTIHEKLTHAYHYGCVYANEGYQTSGPELAIKTLNQNFDLDIREYVAVNFEEAADVVDYFGGIDITITEAERNNMNNMDYGKLYNTGNEVTETGLVHLNGIQACQYSRIRQIDSDNERTNRQGKVLELLLEKVKGLSITQYPSFIKTMLGIVQTSMDYSTILGFTPLISSSLSLQRVTFPQTTDPDEPYYMSEGSEVIGGVYDGAWVWRFDTDVVASYIHNFIYETDIDVETSDYSDESTYDAANNNYSTKEEVTVSVTSSSNTVSENVSKKTDDTEIESTQSKDVSSAVTSSKSTQSSTPVQSSKQTQSSTPVQSSQPIQSSKPTQSSTLAESKPVQSKPVQSEPVSSEVISSEDEDISSYDSSSESTENEVSEVASID
ncbi:MAG: LCP family protein [Acutalibacteraceae bacterium]|nr:LCP family protein [Acutalibacteraceae bacterium]